MSPETVHAIKLIAGTLVAVALVINFFERWYRPHNLLLESSPNIPSWIGWVGWGLASASALAYVLVDYAQ